MQSTHILARDLLGAIGYDADRVASDVPAIVGERIAHADLVAFGRSNGPYDASTATIVVELADQGRRRYDRTATTGQLATALSVPAVIVAGETGWTLFGVKPDGAIEFLRQLDWEMDIGELRHSLSPRSLLEAKLGSRQLALFPSAAVVSDRGRSLRQEALAPRVVHALASAADVMQTSQIANSEDDAHSRAARSVIGALTTVVIRDKTSRQKNGTIMSSDVLVNRAMVEHPQQFSWLGEVSVEERDLTEAIVEQFMDVDFSTVEPALLSELYEHCLVDDAKRRNLGAHYTPPGLARRILSWLPVEEIEPDLRSVYDPTCGSGSLLVAAHDRLRDLQPEQMPAMRLHDDLVARIHGADSDPVAVAIANLALFLNALPAGNGWRVSTRDFFAGEAGDFKPAIIVANPPWLYSNEQSQDDQAQRILARLVSQVAPLGMLGVVLPAGWLSRRSPAAQQSRELLFERLDVLEIWRLPEGTFTRGRFGAAVVLARGPSTGTVAQRPIVRRRIFDRSYLTDFFENGKNDCFLSWRRDASSVARGPLRTWWESGVRAGSRAIGHYATAVIGPQPESPAKLRLRETRLRPNTAVVEWRTVEPFGEVHQASARPVNFPDDMQDRSSRGESLLGRRKILVSNVKDPERAWRLKVAFDDVGDLLVRNTVTAIFPTAERRSPNADDVLFGLFAFLGSGFVSAWLDEVAATRYMSTEDLLAIPAPDPRTLRRLGRLGRRLLVSPEKRPIVGEVERVVWDWLGAPAGVTAPIIRRLNEAEAPEGGQRYAAVEWCEPDADVALVERAVWVVRPRTGTVVDVRDQAITVAVPGLTPKRGRTVALPSRMPGALLYRGASFVVLDDGGPLEDMIYHFDEVAYLSHDDVSAELEALATRA